MVVKFVDVVVYTFLFFAVSFLIGGIVRDYFDKMEYKPLCDEFCSIIEQQYDSNTGYACSCKTCMPMDNQTAFCRINEYEMREVVPV